MKWNSILVVALVGIIAGGCQKEQMTSTPAPKLDYYVESFEAGNQTFQPQNQTSYAYDNAGQLTRYTMYGYNPANASMEEQQHFVFSYANGKVSKIDGTMTGASTPFVTYTYEYGTDMRVSKIKEDNQNTQLTSVANFQYGLASDSIQVAYTYSNGGGFNYKFLYKASNIVGDKTTKASEACSRGAYSYDEFHSPFNSLGYVDYQLLNLSANNKLTENVNYISCFFPVLVPISYTYEYNQTGYPTLATTLFQSGVTTKRSQRKFYYKNPG